MVNDKPEIRDQIELVGCSRDLTARLRRRHDRFIDRTVRLGDTIVVRPMRRVRVCLRALEPYLDQLEHHLERGAISLALGDYDYTIGELRGAYAPAPVPLALTEPAPPEPSIAPTPIPAPAPIPVPEPEQELVPGGVAEAPEMGEDLEGEDLGEEDEEGSEEGAAPVASALSGAPSGQRKKNKRRR